MNDFYNNSDMVLDIPNEGVNRYIAKVFGWMFFGLLLTALSTGAIVVGMYTSDAFLQFIDFLSNIILIVFIAQVLLVGYISVRVTKMNPSTAKILFMLYAITNGLTVGLFALLMAGSGVVTAFAITAVSFGVMALYGLKTNSDLTRAGNLLRMGLIGVLLVIVVNLFLQSPAIAYWISIIGLFVFLGLTAHNTQMIKANYAQVGGTALAENLAIISALMLYLNFINIFMFVLRLMGGRR